MQVIRLYHGTTHAFAAFDDGFRRRGNEPNSCLGIHLTENPALAAQYAEMAVHDRHAGEPVVLAVDVTLDRVGIVATYRDFMGRDIEDPFEDSCPSTEFIDARQELMARGFDGVAVEPVTDDLAGCWVVFEPSRLVIVGRLTVEEAYETECDPVYPDIDFESVTLRDEDRASAEITVP